MIIIKINNIKNNSRERTLFIPFSFCKFSSDLFDSVSLFCFLLHPGCVDVAEMIHKYT